MPPHRPIRCHVYQSPFSLAASLHFTFRETREFSLSFPTYWQTSFGQHTDDCLSFRFAWLSVTRLVPVQCAMTRGKSQDRRKDPTTNKIHLRILISVMSTQVGNYYQFRSIDDFAWTLRVRNSFATSAVQSTRLIFTSLYGVKRYKELQFQINKKAFLLVNVQDPVERLCRS